MARVSFLSLLLCLAALLCTDIYDLDHGFHIAQGNWILANGLPERQILVPPRADAPWTCIYPLGSVALALAWNVAGAAGLVALKAFGYGGAMLLCAGAAVRRGAAPWFACLAVSVAATAVLARYVERPTLFSELLVSLLSFVFAREDVARRIEASPLRWCGAFAAISSVWILTHSGWNIGAFVALMLLLATPLRWPSRAMLALAGIVVPVLVVLLVHPNGARALAGPFFFVGGGGAKFDVFEHRLDSWKAMPLALAIPVTALGAAAVFVRRRRWSEALLLAGLVAGTAFYPRFVLPLATVSLPFVCGLLAERIAALREPLAPRPFALASLLTAILGAVAIGHLPWRSFGFRIDPLLDSRGVGDALARVPVAEGPVLSTFGWGSLLLSNEAVARQGVLMDGRLEEYDREYYERIYLPALSGAPGWPEAVARTGGAFYAEAWPDRTLGTGIARRVRDELGWSLIAWDNSTRLFARPDVVRRHRLPTLEFDPAEFDSIPTERYRELREELRAQVDSLVARGIPATRGHIALARAEVMLGDHAAAAEQLALATRDRGQSFSSWWMVRGMIARAAGDAESLAVCTARLRKLGATRMAEALESR